MGKIGKGVKCSVKGCNNPAIKAVSIIQLKEAKVDLDFEEGGSNVYLCKEHYKYAKKFLRKLRRLEKWRYG